MKKINEGRNKRIKIERREVNMEGIKKGRRMK
jgi:hypothetical protein